MEALRRRFAEDQSMYPDLALQGEPTVGHIKGTVIGQTWSSRTAIARDGVHKPSVAGIWGGKNYAYSVVISGGYDDDIDEGEIILYTGAGGRGKDEDSAYGGNAPQTEDQSFLNRGNAALQRSSLHSQPVRVIRGLYNSEGKVYYRYDGLYDAKLVQGKSGFLICQFRFERRNDQDPLPHIGPPDAIPARPENKPRIRRRRS
ncbi:hypothetical protein EVG20_g4963 [Dentipellis fragilis]|uniref:YDG domain-containing protein n=1 Tax=Dentipellis fragilis TaxID=205917 RepID=A0A4Y9YX17_9AGAM|nr:hypothetical protein EVG20_g4963 [Dentipellis fragilis]